MVNLIVLLISVLTFAVLFCGWKAFSMFTSWRSAAAAVLATDYTELEQLDDRWGMGTLRGWHPLTDGEHTRRIEAQVFFDDEDGTRHRVTVNRYTRRGWSPDGAFVLWYDPSNPANATCFGPGHWLLVALGLAAGLIGLIDTAMKIAH